MKMLKKFGKRSKHNLKKAPTIQDIAIFGYANCKESDPLYKEVFKVSKCLAEAGYTVIDGGGPGVMEAATVGAKAGGGKTVAVTLHSKDMTHFEGVSPKNNFDEEIKTSSYLERTLTLLKEGQVYIIFQGGTGTISEFAMAWGLARLYFGHHKPLILYGKFWNKIIKSFKQTMKMRPEEFKVFKIVDSPEDVLEAIANFEKEIARGEHNHNLQATKSGFLI